MAASPLLNQLMAALRCLPGVGPKSAQRMALHLLERDRDGAARLVEALRTALERIGHCRLCRDLSETQICALCAHPGRDSTLLCIIETPADVLALLRMLCFRPATLEAAVAASPGSATNSHHAASPPAPMPITAASALRPAPPPTQTPAAVSEWNTLVAQLALSGVTKQVAMNCELIEHKDHRFLLALEPSHAQMLTKSAEERLQAALEQHLGKPVTLKFQIGPVNATTPAHQRSQQQAERRQAAAEQTQNDPHVRDMQEMFDARITAIHPLDESDG